MIQCSTSSPLENDKLAQLIDRLDRMQTKMDAMRSWQVENAQLTERLDGLQNKMDTENAHLIERLNSMQSKLDAENDRWTRKFGDLEEENNKLKSQIPHPKFSLSAPNRDDWQSSKVLSSPPTSCQELKNQNGLWPMDGIHLLKKQNKIKAAFCTFAADGSPVSEALIGQLDVKTKSVHFYVQRNSDFKTANAVISFDLARLNEGGAFDLPSGIFTVPLTGIYHFDFSAVKSPSSVNLLIFLQVNGANVGIAFTYQGVTGSDHVVSLSASLRLAAGDRVNLFNAGSSVLVDSANHHTHFTGWLVEEELM